MTDEQCDKIVKAISDCAVGIQFSLAAIVVVLLATLFHH